MNRKANPSGQAINKNWMGKRIQANQSGIAGRG